MGNGAARGGAHPDAVSADRAPLGNTALSRWPPALIVGSAACLQRVVYDLVSIAREGDGRRGATRVTVRAESTDQAVQPMAEDDGPGFAASALACDGPMPASTKLAGMGLGLLMTRERVRASGGTRTVNLPGGGASVRVVLRTT